MAKSVPPRSPSADRSVESESEGDETPELFTKDGEPMKFHLYDVSDERTEVLTEKIIQHGGKITKSESRADIILVTKPAHFDRLKYKWDLEKNKWVCESRWVERCIERGKMVFPNLHVRGMGGRPKGGKEKGVMRRKPVMPFTREDDDHLCQYIAQKIPYKENGGRMGNKIYEELVDRWQKFGQFEWAERHPWTSWRERYKKNQERLDSIINDYVKKYSPEEHGRGEYVLQRRAKPVVQDGEEEEMEEEIEEEIEEEEVELEMWPRDDDLCATEDEEDELIEAPKSKGKGKQKATPVRMEEEEEEEEEAEQGEAANEGDRGSQEYAASIEWEVPPTPEQTQTQIKMAGQKRRRSSGGQSGRSQDASPAKKQKTAKGKQAKQKRAESEYYEEEPAVQDNQHTPAEDGAGPSTQAAASQKPRPRPRAVHKKGQAPPIQGPASSQMTLVNPTQRRHEHQEVEVVIQRTPEKLKPKPKRQAKKAAPPADAPAPYRNTRSRSRSVGVQPQKTRAVSKSKGKKLVAVREEVVAEEQEEDADMEQGNETTEALSVEARLGIVQKENEDEVEDELSADDRQTEQRLAQALDAEQEDLDFMPEDAIDPTDGSSSEGSGSMEQLPQMLEAPKAKAKPPSFRGPRPPISSDRVRSKRADTYSREEEFPSPNTKTHEVRKREMEQRKKEPYVPPAGTKARQLRARG